MEDLLVKLEKEMKDNEGFIIKAYDVLQDSLVSDCSINKISDYATAFCEYTVAGILIPEGENVAGEEFMEFYVNEDSLKEIIAEVFYEPLNG